MLYIQFQNIFKVYMYTLLICNELNKTKIRWKKRIKKTQDALTYGGAQEEMEDFKKYLRISKSLFVKAEGTYNEKDRLHFYYLQKNKKVKGQTNVYWQ